MGKNHPFLMEEALIDVSRAQREAHTRVNRDLMSSKTLPVLFTHPHKDIYGSIEQHQFFQNSPPNG